MKQLRILGAGCLKCQKLAETAETAARELGIECEIEKIRDINQIIEYGVMVTPALVVDGEVKSSGKLPSLDDVKRMLGGME